MTRMSPSKLVNGFPRFQATDNITAWYQSGADVQRLLPQLSTYLGHLGLAETQHYLTMTPELLREASRRFESYACLEVGHDE